MTVEIAANWIAGQAAVDAAKVAGQKLYYDYARRYYSSTLVSAYFNATDLAKYKFSEYQIAMNLFIK